MTDRLARHWVRDVSRAGWIGGGLASVGGVIMALPGDPVSLGLGVVAQGVALVIYRHDAACERLGALATVDTDD